MKILDFAKLTRKRQLAQQQNVSTEQYQQFNAVTYAPSHENPPTMKFWIKNFILIPEIIHLSIKIIDLLFSGYCICCICLINKLINFDVLSLQINLIKYNLYIRRVTVYHEKNSNVQITNCYCIIEYCME